MVWLLGRYPRKSISTSGRYTSSLAHSCAYSASNAGSCFSLFQSISMICCILGSAVGCCTTGVGGHNIVASRRGGNVSIASLSGSSPRCSVCFDCPAVFWFRVSGDAVAAGAGGVACSACSLAHCMLLVSIGAMSDLAASNEMGMIPSISGSCAAHGKKSAIHMSCSLWYLTTKEYFCKISRSLAM